MKKKFARMQIWGLAHRASKKCVPTTTTSAGRNQRQNRLRERLDWSWLGMHTGCTSGDVIAESCETCRVETKQSRQRIADPQLINLVGTCVLLFGQTQLQLHICFYHRPILPPRQECTAQHQMFHLLSVPSWQPFTRLCAVLRSLAAKQQNSHSLPAKLMFAYQHPLVHSLSRLTSLLDALCRCIATVSTQRLPLLTINHILAPAALDNEEPRRLTDRRGQLGRDVLVFSLDADRLSRVQR